MANPVVTNREQLVDEAVFNRFADEVARIVQANDEKEALEGRFVLEEMLLGRYPLLESQAPDLYHRYQELIALLKFIALSTRPMPDIVELLRKQLTVGLKSSIGLRDKFQDVLDLYDDIILGGRIAETLFNAMLSCSERLAEGTITVRGLERPAQATIGNFLRDYQLSTLPPAGVEKRAGSVERITYINQNPNCRKLSKESRDLLLRAMEIFDWLRFGSAPITLEMVLRGETVSRESGLSRYAAQREKTLPPPPRPQARIKSQELRIKEGTPSPPKTIPPIRPSLTQPKDRLSGFTVSPAPPSPRPSPGKPFSVNEAIIRGGINGEDPGGHGVSAGHKEVQEKLKSLEKKLEDKKDNYQH